MPTNQNAYNSRVTDEALEKRFRDTFRSQGGAELVDDLYASGVIVPVVDFTAAAAGDVLAQNLQTAWDSSTDNTSWESNASGTLVSNAGFWQVDVVCGFEMGSLQSSYVSRIQISDGLSANTVWSASMRVGEVTEVGVAVTEQKFVVFLRSGDSLTYQADNVFNSRTTAWYRQIADVSGNLINPSGFTSS